MMTKYGMKGRMVKKVLNLYWLLIYSIFLATNREKINEKNRTELSKNQNDSPLLKVTQQYIKYINACPVLRLKRYTYVKEFK